MYTYQTQHSAIVVRGAALQNDRQTGEYTDMEHHWLQHLRHINIKLKLINICHELIHN